MLDLLSESKDSLTTESSRFEKLKSLKLYNFVFSNTNDHSTMKMLITILNTFLIDKELSNQRFSYQLFILFSDAKNKVFGYFEVSKNKTATGYGCGFVFLNK